MHAPPGGGYAKLMFHLPAIGEETDQTPQVPSHNWPRVEAANSTSSSELYEFERTCGFQYPEPGIQMVLTPRRRLFRFIIFTWPS